MKKCLKCEEIKDATHYREGRGICNECRNKARRELNKTKNNAVLILEKECGECKVTKPSSEFHKSKQKHDGLMWSCKECRNAKLKQRYIEKGTEIRERTNAYYYANKDIVIQKQLKRQKERLKTDPKYLLTRRLRNRLYYALKKKSWKKDTKFYEYIGCELDILKQYIEKQFSEGMNWDNHGEWHIDHKVPLDSAKSETELYKLCHYTNLRPLWARDNIIKGIKIQ